MAQASLGLLFALLLLLSVQGDCGRCALSSVKIQQSNSGTRVGALDTVFEVTVTNQCGCAVSNVFLRSDGFASSVAVDPKLFRRQGVGYLLGDGRPIPSSKSVKFRYAWDHYFKMTPANLQVDCS